jgi:Putative beta-lactamase-inhibitor-like, PepSY-like
MKKILTALTIFISLFWITSANAQVVDVPKKAKDHFFKKYPDAKNADWNNNVVSYAVKFQLNNHTNRAYYHMDGRWDYTETYVEESELPAAVKESLSKSRFSDWKKEACALVESNKGKKTYRIEVQKGIEKKSVFYNSKGKEVKSSVSL